MWLRMTDLTNLTKVQDDDTITDDTHIAQTKGGPENNPNYSIQFFVSTKYYEGNYNPSLKIKIVVTGLTSANHEATFTLPDTVDIDTIQTTSLEDGDQQIDKGVQVGRF